MDALKENKNQMRLLCISMVKCIF